MVITGVGSPATKAAAQRLRRNACHWHGNVNASIHHTAMRSCLANNELKTTSQVVLFSNP